MTAPRRRNSPSGIPIWTPAGGDLALRKPGDEILVSGQRQGDPRSGQKQPHGHGAEALMLVVGGMWSQVAATRGLRGSGKVKSPEVVFIHVEQGQLAVRCCCL